MLVLAVFGIAIWAEAASPPENAPVVTWPDYFVFLAQAICYAFLLSSLVLLATRRLIFSLVVTITMMLDITLLSKTKYVYLQQKLLFSDFVYQLRERAEITFFVQNYTLLALTALAILVCGLGLLVFTFIIDPSRVRRRYALVMVLVSIPLIELAWGEVHPILYRGTVFAHASASNRHLSNFTISARMFIDSVREPLTLGDISAAKPEIVPALSEPALSPSTRPHIIVILHESSVDPAIYMEGEKYAVPHAFFASGDNEVRRLIVKTYGGKTWISEHGFVLGVDVSYFGIRKDFLAVIATGKFKDSIAHELKNNGYRTVVDYPAPTTFLYTNDFYHSLGFDVVRSDKEMNLEATFTGARPRDRAFYQFMMDDIAKQQNEKGDVGPQFYFVLTSATHYPWNYQEFPGIRDEEYIPGDPIAEFSRRQRIAADDLAWLKASLAERFPGQPFLIAGFGDHHPLWTHDYVHNFPSWKGRKPDPAEDMWRTYYRVDGVNFRPNYEALSREIEIGLLGESLLTAANLSLSKSYQVRRWLREQCEGLWAHCRKEDSLLAANALLSRGPLAIFNEER
jgi:phosphoglycerol transferase MdoB-like AlkP superfamily enzyme